MEKLDIIISPLQVLTRNRNMVQVTIHGCDVSSIHEIGLFWEFRLKTDGKVEEVFMLSSKRISRAELPEILPIRIGWEIDISKKGPITFKSKVFSIEYVIIVVIGQVNGEKIKKELPLTVIPGRIDETELDKERD